MKVVDDVLIGGVIGQRYDEHHTEAAEVREGSKLEGDSVSLPDDLPTEPAAFRAALAAVRAEADKPLR